MTDSNPSPAPVPDQGVFARALGVIVSPGATFKVVAAAPRPAIILLLVCLVTALSTGLPQFTERGRQATLDLQVQQVERFTGQTVTPQAYAQMESRARLSGYITMVSIFVVVPVASLLFAGIFWFVFNVLLAGTATFRQVLGVVTHSQVIGALGALVAAPIMYLQGVVTSAGPFNLGALVPMLEPGNPAKTFLGAVSFFTLWAVVVEAVGLGVLYRRRVGPIAGLLISAYLILTAAFTLGFSLLTGR